MQTARTEISTVSRALAFADPQVQVVSKQQVVGYVYGRFKRIVLIQLFD